MLQMPHALGDFGLTPNVIAQTSVKVAMAARFLGLVGSLPLDEQQLWLPNQLPERICDITYPISSSPYYSEDIHTKITLMVLLK